MSAKWVELAKKRFDTEDQIRKEYEVRLEGKYGWLVMANRMLLFIEEEGFLSKSYNIGLEVPYEKIDNLDIEGDQLVITDSEGRKHICKRETVDLLIIKNSLEALIQSALAKVTA